MRTRREVRPRPIGTALLGCCLLLAGLAGGVPAAGAARASVAGPSANASTTAAVVYPYSCTTTFVGGATYSGQGQIEMVDVFNGPGLHMIISGVAYTQVQVTVDVGAAALSALQDTGTTTWTSSDARLTWGGELFPEASFAWTLPAPRFSFTTPGFEVPLGDTSPGGLTWGFRANSGVQAGFESGQTSCTPTPPVQVYETFLLAGGPSCAFGGVQWTCRFFSTGAPQLWQVPADVTRVTVDVRGAGGSPAPTNIDVEQSLPGGRGGESSATLAVRPGELLQLNIGGSNGFNGGGTSVFFGGSGGGGSDIRRSPFSLASRLVVAGGGGGGGFSVFSDGGSPGGAGGGVAGVGAGGGPGTQTAGGAAEAVQEPAIHATAGRLGFGGDGTAGGGGGYYGGGGSTASATNGDGGGGGSGFVPPGAGNTTVVGTNSGDGSIAIVYRSTTTPYMSHYDTQGARSLYIDTVFLHHHDVASTQHDAAMFMSFLAGIIRSQKSTPPAFGSDAGTGPLTVTTAYSAADNTALQDASELFGSDPPTLQRVGVTLLAFLIQLSG